MKPRPYSTIQVPALHCTDVASPAWCTMVSPANTQNQHGSQRLPCIMLKEEMSGIGTCRAEQPNLSPVLLTFLLLALTEMLGCASGDMNCPILSSWLCQLKGRGSVTVEWLCPRMWMLLRGLLHLPG